MAEATPITEESTMQKFFSSDNSHLQVTDFQLKTDGSFSSDEAIGKRLYYGN